MLQIQDIHKKYVTGDLVQTALDGVSLTLRDNEFVAILGPSGSGKTTLLNVIGGLDRYDSGDLIINGISTKKYSDRDWDSYRNHTIGFVFQSYNLIPHQTVLANVELALTISGISGAERRNRAISALEAVGLGNQIHKRPNQMSGGQMQRVAIARALVNNPDILLADEPTGALDSATSIQVMELLKEVSKDRLVVMVTHNPELAEEYANRIVRVKDGKIIGDSNPYVPNEADILPAQHKNMGKASMSFLTALSLSFNNLRTKKGRTLLTAFAGSIGIIGIALILALSAGFQSYVDKIQEDTLSSYPLVIRSETANMASAMASFSQTLAKSGNEDKGTVMEQPMISQMFASMGSNDLSSFKSYLEDHMDQIGHTLNSVNYSYGIRPYIYASYTSDRVHQVNPGNLFAELMNGMPIASFMDMDLFQEMLDNRELLETQYNVMQGRWPEKYNELVIVLNSPTQMSDYMSYTLGLRDPGNLSEMIQQVLNGQDAAFDSEMRQWTYDDLMSLKFRMVNASDLYRYNEAYKVWENMSEDEDYMKKAIEHGEELSVVGIIAPKDRSATTALSPGVAYTSDLTKHVIQCAKESEIVQQQLAHEDIDVFTGTKFGSDQKAEINFEDMIHVDGDLLSSAFGMDISEDAIVGMMAQYMENAAGSIEIDTQPAQNDFINYLSEMSVSMLNGYIAQHADDTGSATLALVDAEKIVDQYLASPEAGEKLAALATNYQLPEDSFRRVYRPLLFGLVTGYIASDLAETVIPDPTMPTPTEPTVPAPTCAPTAPPATSPSVEETAPSTPSASTDATTPAASIAPSISSETEHTAEQAAVTEDADTAETTAPNAAAVPAEFTIADVSIPPVDPPAPIEPEQIAAPITYDDVARFVPDYISTAVVTGAGKAMATQMVQPQVQKEMMALVSQFGESLLNYIGNSFYVDTDKIADAFEFEMNEDELMRLMRAMSARKNEQSAKSNLNKLGYVEMENPSAISIYFVDFASKETFLDFLDHYNQKMEAADQPDLVINYTDFTGMMMSSVRTIIDSVSYVLIAFVAVSLVVSSIMIGIITYISVMERTKEIGVLRAIGASKHNISQVFNAETFIIGLCSGLIGVGLSLLLLIPCNYIIHTVWGNANITARLPIVGGVVLILLSMILTLMGGLIPSKKAAQKDPVIALRSE